MQARNWYRGLWSRQTLAAKLTISYTAALLLIAVVVAVIAGFAVVIELRRASIDAAARAAETTAMAIEETVEAYHNSFLLTKVEAATQVLGQLNPQSDRDSAIAYVASHDQETKGFLFLLDQSGQIIYHPQGADSALDMGTIDAASQIATSGPGFHRYTGQSRESGDRAVYHSYSAPVPRWDWIVVAAEEEEHLLRTIPDDALYRILEIGAPGLIDAAAVLYETGEQIAASAEWSKWAGQALPLVSLDGPGVAEVALSFGDESRHVAYTQLPSLNATVAVIYVADYLEELLGRFVLLLAGAGAIALIVVTVVSRQAAAFVTAPVRRAARHLIGSAANGTAKSERGDELASLVRRLLRTSVKLDYERRHREQAEHELEITATVYRNMGEGIVIFEPDGTVSRVNPAFAAITGYSIDDLRGKTPEALVSPDKTTEYVDDVWEALQRNGEWVGEIEIVCKSGKSVPILLSIRGVFGDGKPRHYIGVARDISDIRSTQTRLQHLATHDPLTDLTNRTYLSESLERIVRSRQRHGGAAAVLFIDVDHFKDVNDAHGHHAGDELLQTIAMRLKNTIRAEDIIARFGGDEFVVVITEFDDPSMVDEVVRRMLNSIREPATVGGIIVRPSATAGIAVFPESGTTPEDLLKNADAAMYEAKRVGRGSYRYHDPDINEAVRVRLAVQDRVRFSLRTGEFVLLWQPVVRVTDSQIVGAEALIRLRNNDTLEPPASFMPQIEGSQVIMELANWVLADTAETLARLGDTLPEGFRVAVNVSATEIFQRNFVPLVLETLKAHSVASSRLAVEVTEGSAIRDIPTAQSVIRGLRRSGINVYLDDFGVGYSSLQYLRELGVDTVKLDKSFLLEVPESDASCSLVRGVVEMAHGLGLTTTVEGVERQEQFQYLHLIGCDTVQGYYTGRPMLVDELVTLLESSTGST